MTVYFAGTEIMDFDITQSSLGNMITDISSGRRHTANTRCCVLCPGISTSDINYLTCSFSAAATSLWAHWTQYVYNVNFSSTYPYVKLRSSGVDKLTVRQPGSSVGIFEVSQWNGSSWTDLLTATNAIGVGIHDFDWHVVLGNPGTITVYVDGTPLMSSTTLDLSAISALDELRLQGYNSGFSEVIVADWNTIGARVVSAGPSGAGNYSQWTGVYTAVDEATDGGTDYVTSDTAGQRESFAFPSVTLNTGEVIAAVGVGAEGFRDTTSPQNVNLFARVASTDYDDATQAMPASMGFLTPKIWETNPATSAAWTAADAGTAELGVRSQA